MLIDFKQAQLQQFEQCLAPLLADPQRAFAFDSVADFYQAAWLHDLPSSARYWVSGLDDGAEEFDIKIQCQGYALQIHVGEQLSVQYGKITK